MYKAFWSIPKFEEDGFPKKDEVLSFHWGVMQSRKAWENDQTGSSSGVRDFSVIRQTDKQSYILFTAVANGTDIPLIKVYLTKVTDKTIETWATYTFEKGVISSLRPGGGGSDRPLEEVSVTFEKVKFEYKKD